VVFERISRESKSHQGDKEKRDKGQSRRPAIHPALRSRQRQKRNAMLHHPSHREDQWNGQNDKGKYSGEKPDEHSRNGANHICDEHTENRPAPRQSATVEKGKRTTLDRNGGQQPRKGTDDKHRTGRRGPAQKLIKRHDGFAAPADGRKAEHQQNNQRRHHRSFHGKPVRQSHNERTPHHRFGFQLNHFVPAGLASRISEPPCSGRRPSATNPAPGNHALNCPINALARSGAT